MSHLRRILSTQGVPLLFLAVSVYCIVEAKLSMSRTSADVLERFARNIFLVLSLVIPIVAGLGLNFGIVLGAMAGQIGLMTAQNGALPGTGGLIVAVITSIPLAMGLGYLTGLLFNRARGREMITGIMLGLFASGVYQFVFLILAGPVIPLHAPDVILPQGMGVRVTVNLTTVERGIDGIWAEPLRFGGEYWGEIPVVTLGLGALLLVGIVLFFRTKLGQDLRATGQDPDIAEVAGVNVRRCRIIAVILSMVLAGIGQIIYLQNMGTMNTFTQHEQVGFYAIAALLVGGATVVRATVWNAVVGTFLFHTMITVVAVAGRKIALEYNIPEPAQVGEYLREFVAFAVIGTALALHAWRTRGRSL